MRLLILLCIAFLIACRSDRPPPMTICILDRFGGGHCVDPTGVRVYKYPKDLENYWSANANDMRAFSAWCYGINNADVQVFNSNLEKFEKTIERNE